MDDLGNEPTGSGTGFWINTEDKHSIFATNVTTWMPR